MSEKTMDIDIKSSDSLEDLCNRLHKKVDGKRILVIGDLMLDAYVEGDAARISPEAPVPVVNNWKKTYRLGGAANVAVNIKRLGATPIVIGISGKDEAGDVLEDLMREEGISDPELSSEGNLVLRGGRPTTEKTRFMAGGQQLMRLDSESTEPMAGHEQFVMDFIEELDHVDAVIVSDYGKGFLSEPLLKALSFHFSHLNVPTFVDPTAHRSLKDYKGFNFITPNMKEAEVATGHAPGSASPVALSMAVSAGTWMTAEAIVTCGADGMYAHLGESIYSDSVHVKTKAREVFDVSGAGDTVISALAVYVATVGVSLDRFQPLKFLQSKRAVVPEAMEFASYAAAVAIAKQGTYAPTTEEIVKYMREASLDLVLV